MNKSYSAFSGTEQRLKISGLSSMIEDSSEHLTYIYPFTRLIHSNWQTLFSLQSIGSIKFINGIDLKNTNNISELK